MIFAKWIVFKHLFNKYTSRNFAIQNTCFYKILHLNSTEISLFTYREVKDNSLTTTTKVVIKLIRQLSNLLTG